jgi:hypothetical protein
MPASTADASPSSRSPSSASTADGGESLYAPALLFHSDLAWAQHPLVPGEAQRTRRGWTDRGWTEDFAISPPYLAPQNMSSPPNTTNTSGADSANVHVSSSEGAYPPILTLGPAMSGAEPHRHGPAWNALLHGCKKWYLMPRSSRFPSRKAHRSTQAWLNSSDHTFQNPPFECTQRAGEVMLTDTLYSQTVLTDCTHRLYSQTVLTDCTHALYSCTVLTHCSHTLFSHTVLVRYTQVMLVPNDWWHATLSLTVRYCAYSVCAVFDRTRHATNNMLRLAKFVAFCSSRIRSVLHLRLAFAGTS